jgi:hypothetical protein
MTVNRLRHALDRAATEADLQSAVIDLAAWSGWRSMHVRPVTDRDHRTRAPTTCAGWPDLVLWRPGQLLAVELKTQTGRLTAAQRDVLDSLAAAGLDVQVWRLARDRADPSSPRQEPPAAPLSTF